MMDADHRAQKRSPLAPDQVRHKLRALRIDSANRQMLEYWLSLSCHGAVPLRDAFDPAGASGLLAGCALFDVVPGQSVHCRIAGMVVKLALGAQIIGRDLLAITPVRYRHQRLVRFSAVAQGAIGLARRVIVTTGREPVPREDIMLPFADVTPDGAHPVLVHTTWRPSGEEWFGVDPMHALTLADEFHLVALD